METVAAPERKRSAFGVLRLRDFRLFWVGACLSFIGSWVQAVAMGLLVYKMTGSKQALGIIGLVGGLPTTAFMLFGGVIADRANKRNLVLFTQSLFGLNAFILAFLCWSGHIQIWHIGVLSFVNGLVFAIDGPARQAMVYDLVGRDDLSAGVALQSVAFNLARVIGPAVGGLIYAAVGPGACFFVNGVSFGALLLSIFFIRTDLTRRGEAQGTVWSDLIEGLLYLRSNGLMMCVLALTAVTNLFAFSNYNTLMPAYAKDVLHIGDRDGRYGLLFSCIGIGSVAGAYSVGRLAAAERRGLLMTGGALVFSVSLLVLARTTVPWMADIVFVVVGMSAIAQIATANTLTQSLAPPRFRGRAVSLHMFVMGGLQPLGAMLSGSVAQRYGVPHTVSIGALICGAFALLLFTLKPAVVRLK